MCGIGWAAALFSVGKENDLLGSLRETGDRWQWREKDTMRETRKAKRLRA